MAVAVMVTVCGHHCQTPAIFPFAMPLPPDRGFMYSIESAVCDWLRSQVSSATAASYARLNLTYARPRLLPVLRSFTMWTDSTWPNFYTSTTFSYMSSFYYSMNECMHAHIHVCNNSRRITALLQAVRYCAILCSSAQYCTSASCEVLCNTVQYCAILRCCKLCSTVQHSDAVSCAPPHSTTDDIFMFMYAN